MQSEKKEAFKVFNLERVSATSRNTGRLNKIQKGKRASSSEWFYLKLGYKK